MYDSYEDDEKTILDQSFTIQQLIDALGKYPKDMKIITTWESSITPIQKRDLYLSKNGKFVYLDADNCLDKDDFANDPNENE